MPIPWICGAFRRSRYLYGFFTSAPGTIVVCRLRKESLMDLWFIGLIVVLTLLTWGGIIVCERLLVRP